MVEVCTLNKDGTIHLTKEELETMLNRAYNEGRNSSPTYYPVYPYYYHTSPTYKYSYSTNTDCMWEPAYQVIIK